ncbi:hypothetical protein [Actinomadura kijaniata]|uniref:hypothetical protein n=1 Tax=Actinomadura kijaniata TaxID=46161 RepID=UPI00082AB53A|nr:hypothetical protein [Actinomadura kijaniata]
MKIRCVCGAVIVDQSDFLPDKARLIADRDWEDVLHPEGDAPLERVRERAWRWSRSLWQCAACGRLYVDDRNGRPHRFDPAEADVPRDLLGSVHGERWKGHLRGYWRASRPGAPGDLWWSCGADDEGFEEFTSREALERRYREVFARLRSLDILRSALLSEGERTVHRWPEAAPGRVTPG